MSSFYKSERVWLLSIIETALLINDERMSLSNANDVLAKLQRDEEIKRA
jgi:hypothetical protein